MKRFAFYTKIAKLCFLCLSMAAMPQQSMAQVDAEHAGFYGEGMTIEELNQLQSSGKETRILLYNLEKDMFLNAGGFWGTRTATFTVGLPLLVMPNHDNNNYYKIKGPFRNTETGGEYLGLVPEGNTSKTRGVYFDQKDENGIYVNWEFEKIADSKEGNVYRIKVFDGTQEYYLCSNNLMTINVFQQGNSNLVRAMTITEIRNRNPRETHWKIVSEEYLEDMFPDTYNKERPSDATFMLRAQGFNRLNKYNTYDSESGRGWQKSGTMTFSNDFSGEFFDDKGNDLYTQSNVDQNFGMFYCGGIKKAAKGAKLFQKVKLHKSGWYQVECQGFFNDEKDKTEYAKLYAKTTNATSKGTPEWKSMSLLGKSYGEEEGRISLEKVPVREETFDKIEFLGKDIRDNKVSNKVEAGVVFYCKVYPNYLTFYANFDENEGQDIEIGIEIDKDMTDNDYVYFDDFRLKYLGESFALDEGWNNFKDGSTAENSDYASKYVNRPLILKRTMTAGKWNSLCLPVDLTKRQITQAFTAKVEIAKLCNAESGREGAIAFQTLKLDSYSDDDVVTRKGEAFIIKPLIGDLTQEGYIDIGDRGETKITAPFYTISRVSLCKKELLEEEIKIESLKRFLTLEYNGDVVIDGDHFFTVNGDGYKDCKLRVYATFEKETIVPANAYVMHDSNLYHLPGQWDKAAGYSWWIEDEHQSIPGAKGHRLAFISMDGIGDNTTTAIEGFITMDATERDLPAAVYSIYGQVVRRGTTSLEGLPSGMYIVNGKKVAVR